MNKNIHKWTIVTLGGDSYVESGDYWLILDKLYINQKMQKNGTRDLANCLMMDGKVVIESDLFLKAIRYGEERERAVVEAVTAARLNNLPEWLEVED
jgi:hypothetical protein